MGSLRESEIAKLSNLCTVQASRKPGLSTHLGFSDVEPDLVAELVIQLEKHVNAASNVNLIAATHRAIQHEKSTNHRLNIDQVCRQPLLVQYDM